MSTLMTWLTRYESLALLGAVGAYLAATLAFWIHLFFRSGRLGGETAELASRSPVAGRALLLLGLILHGLALLGEGGVLFTLQAGVASLFGFALVLVYLLASARLGGATPGAFVTPVALLASLYGLAAPPLHLSTPPHQLELRWLMIHVSITLIGYVALAFAFAAAVTYLLQEDLLKRKKLSGLWQKLPPLQVADGWIYRATAFGLAMLTLGLSTGLMWQWWARPEYSVWRDPKVLVSLATWLTFALYLTARWWLGWRGRRSNLVVVCGFVLLVISFLGTPHLLPFVSGQ
jgi:ABC-type uncharacterized transport system permease subunit